MRLFNSLSTALRRHNTAVLDSYKFGGLERKITRKNRISESFADQLRAFKFRCQHSPEMIYESEIQPIGHTITDNYFILEYPKPKKSNISKYRTKKVYSESDNVYILLKFAVLNNNKTQLTSIWYPIESNKAQELIKQYKFKMTTESVKSLTSPSFKPPNRRIKIPSPINTHSFSLNRLIARGDTNNSNLVKWRNKGVV